MTKPLPSGTRSDALFRAALDCLPGGVSSPVRAFGHVGGTPVYLRRGAGAHVEDEDGKRYLDFCLAWGPLVLGHAHPTVVEAVARAAQDGLAFGACHAFESALAEKILQGFPHADRVRFVVSGTEAVMTAVRLARAHTDRPLVLKFAGAYHGHADSMLVKAGSGIATLGIADSAGVTAATAAETLVVPAGDESAIADAFHTHGDRIAAAIVEPVPANNGLLPLAPGFLRTLRRVTRDHGALLIFDEVITGFRFGFHGYGPLVDVEPDLVTLGKIVGGGLPVGAVCGPRAILERLAPTGNVYQAGTMAGNPVALAAGLATLEILRTSDAYATLERLGAHLDAAVHALPASRPEVVRVGSIFWTYFGTRIPRQPEAIEEVAVSEYRRRYATFLAKGVYLPPSAYEVGFLCTAHRPEDLVALASALATPPDDR